MKASLMILIPQRRFISVLESRDCPTVFMTKTRKFVQNTTRHFDFKLSEVIENDTKEKVALTEEEEQALLSFIKTDNVYHKYYDEVLILLKTGLRISELCGLTMADIDFKNEVVVVSHQLLKSKEQGYYTTNQRWRLITQHYLSVW